MIDKIENPIEIIGQIYGRIFLDDDHEKNEIFCHVNIEKTGDYYKDFVCSIESKESKWNTEINCHVKYDKGSIRHDAIMGSLIYQGSSIGDKTPTEETIVTDNTDTTLTEVIDSDTGIAIKNTEVLGKLYYMGVINEEYERENNEENKNKHEVFCHLRIEEERESNLIIPSRIQVEELVEYEEDHFHIKYHLPGHLEIVEDGIKNIQGHVAITEDDVEEVFDKIIHYNILGKLELIENDEPTIEITDEKIEYNLQAHLELIEDNKEIVEIPSHLVISKDWMNEFLCSLYLENEYVDIVSRIEVINEREKIYDNEILGSVTIEGEYTKLVLQGFLTLNETGNVKEDLINGSISIEKRNIHDDLEDTAITTDEGYFIQSNEILGHVKIYNHFKALDFLCTIKTLKRDFVHSIFSRITVPPSRTISFPCKIMVDNTNLLKYDLMGSVTIDERDSFSKDILNGNLYYEEGVCKDIVGHAYIDPIYTRKEFDCSIIVRTISDISFPCTIEVGYPKVDTVEEPKIKDIPTGYYPSYHQYDHRPFDFDKHKVHIEVKDNEVVGYEYSSRNRVEEEVSELPKGKVVIAVSPKWHYEAMVFKNSLITFLDRYYRKMDLSIVFGGSKRADFDIINLALNYKIRPNHLQQIPIDIDYRNPFIAQRSIDRFIYTMNEFRKDEDIVRVFLFMNHPNWYHHDPLARLANYCKDNQISCVAISDGGEWREILEIDKTIDQMINNIELDRQYRWRPVKGYINKKLTIDNDDRIVY